MVDLLAVDDEETRDAARSLIAEYLRWIADAAAERYRLSFDVEAMVTSDLDDRSEFYPPRGRSISSGTPAGTWASVASRR